MFLLRVDELLRRVHTVMELPEAGLYTVLRLPLVGHTLNLKLQVLATNRRKRMPSVAPGLPPENRHRLSLSRSQRYGTNR